MNSIPILLFEMLGIIGIFLTVWSTNTRGEWSQNIGIIGGLLWLPSVVIIFIRLGIENGVIYLIATFIVGNIIQKILQKYFIKK